MKIKILSIVGIGAAYLAYKYLNAEASESTSNSCGEWEHDSYVGCDEEYELYGYYEDDE